MSSTVCCHTLSKEILWTQIRVFCFCRLGFASTIQSFHFLVWINFDLLCGRVECPYCHMRFSFPPPHSQIIVCSAFWRSPNDWSPKHIRFPPVVSPWAWLFRCAFRMTRRRFGKTSASEQREAVRNPEFQARARGSLIESNDLWLIRVIQVALLGSHMVPFPHKLRLRAKGRLRCHERGRKLRAPEWRAKRGADSVHSGTSRPLSEGVPYFYSGKWWTINQARICVLLIFRGSPSLMANSNTVMHF